MKNLILILIILLIISTSFKRALPYSFSTLKEKEKPVTLMTITRSKMQILSSFGHKNHEWVKLHVKPLKIGLNKGYLALSEKQVFKYEIINYE